MGAWIETPEAGSVGMPLDVAPYVGAWIETDYRLEDLLAAGSHPTWVRGLKQAQVCF